jgi:L-threonylcarbamoyladenylate synthase
MTKTIKISDGFDFALDAAIVILAKGGLVVFPTDTVYGLGAAVMNRDSIERIFDLKGRDHTKAIAVLLASLEQLEFVSFDFPEIAKKLGEIFWPGALTMVVKRKKNLPADLSPDDTIGIRIPNHEFARTLISRTGPLAVTSANLTGQASATNAAMAIAQVGNLVDLIIDGGESIGGVASTVIDCTGEPLKILREGALTRSILQKKMDIEFY